ncbi:MAG: FtsX-like permease family protein [Rhodanobacteraceae bacterium]|nr:MAG: FtsX-like permease family protein [Rhodanobacteraceae bacterium]
MTLPPIIAALKKHKAGVILITLQIALTLAIVCNAVFVIGQRVATVQRPTGMDEQNLFVIQQMFVNAPSGNGAAAVEQRYAMIQGDLATLRGLPDVESAAAISSLPLVQSSNNGGVDLKPNQSNSTARSTFYSVGEQAIHTLGLRLIAGRNFTAGEITHDVHGGDYEPPVTIVTKALGDKLFPAGDALGKTVYFNGGATPTTIIGIVARMQTPNIGFGNDYTWNSVLLPTFPNDSYTRTAVRAKPGRMAEAMREAHKALLAADPMRVLAGFGGLLGIQPFSEIRAKAYRADVGMAILMGVICVILLCVTGAGIVGLTSFWVGQRRKQIGIRRALGATRTDILRYFQTENLLIAGAGVVLGAILAVGLNLWMMKQFQMDRMSLAYVAVGIVALLALGQGAVFAPARRASRVSPVEATRSV